MGEQVVLDLGGADGAHGRHAQHVAGGVVEALQRGQQQLARAVGDVAADELALGGQGLHEQRVAAGALEEGGGLVGRQFAAPHGGGHLRGLLAREGGQFVAQDGGQAFQLQQQPAQRVAAVEVVAAVGGHDLHGGGVEVAQQEHEQVARGGVGPVQVLDDDGDALGAGHGGQQPQHLLEQQPPGLAPVVGRGAQLGQQAGEFLAAAGGQGVEDAAAVVAQHLPQHGDEGGEGQAVHAQLQAPAGEDPAVGQVVGELRQQPGFAHSGLSAEQQGRRRARARGVRVVEEEAEFLPASHEHGPRADGSGDHAVQYAVRCGLFAISFCGAHRRSAASPHGAGRRW